MEWKERQKGSFSRDGWCGWGLGWEMLVLVPRVVG